MTVSVSSRGFPPGRPCALSLGAAPEYALSTSVGVDTLVPIATRMLAPPCIGGANDVVESLETRSPARGTRAVRACNQYRGLALASSAVFEWHASSCHEFNASDDLEHGMPPDVAEIPRLLGLAIEAA